MAETEFTRKIFGETLAEYGAVDSSIVVLRAVEQIRSCVAYPNVNVKLVGSYAGLSDFKDGPTHHSIMDISVMRSMPNMTVIVPSDGTEIRKMIPLVAQRRGPVYLRISRADMVKVFPGDHQPEIGKGIIVREGRDVTVITNGHMLSRSLEE